MSEEKRFYFHYFIISLWIATGSLAILLFMCDENTLCGALLLVCTLICVANLVVVIVADLIYCQFFKTKAKKD